MWVQSPEASPLSSDSLGEPSDRDAGLTPREGRKEGRQEGRIEVGKKEGRKGKRKEGREEEGEGGRKHD